MSHLLPAVLLIAVADSINPSTVVPALYLAAGETAISSLIGFITGVFIISVAAGTVVLLGPGEVLLALVPRPGIDTRHLLELCVGVALFAVAAVLWRGRGRVARHVANTGIAVDRSSFRVGAGIMGLELPTAFPYFAAIALILGSDSGLLREFVALVIFNLAFVTPLLAILLLRCLAHEAGRERLERLRAGLDARLAVVLPGLVLVAAVALATLGTIGVTTD